MFEISTTKCHKGYYFVMLCMFCAFLHLSISHKCINVRNLFIINLCSTYDTKY